jgi:hypothetical protein
MLGTWAWDKLTPTVKKFFATPEGLTEAQQAEIEAAVRAQLEEEKAKQEKDKAEKEEREGIVSRGEGRGGAGYGGGFGGGFGGAGGFGGSGGRRGKITIEEDILPARSGGHIRAMQAGGMTAPNPYGAAVGEDYNFGFAAGGLGSLPEYKAGGKLLDGPGDGMSDDIPAVIRGKGVQRAALADGEFVIPADVVSHLGNGSTKAGAKKLYQMMAQIRKARTGKTKQAPAVKTDKYLPA